MLIYNILSIFSSVSVHHSSKNRGPKPRDLSTISRSENPRTNWVKQLLVKNTNKTTKTTQTNKTKTQNQIKLKLKYFKLYRTIVIQLSVSIFRNILSKFLFQEPELSPVFQEYSFRNSYFSSQIVLGTLFLRTDSSELLLGSEEIDLTPRSEQCFSGIHHLQALL